MDTNFKESDENKNKRSKKPSVLTVTLISMVALVFIFLFWFYWQNMRPEQPEAEAGNTLSNVSFLEGLLLGDKNEPDPPEELADETQKIFPTRDEFYYALPETASEVDNSYFDDALFIGDSITTGILHYMEKDFPELAVVAERGVHIIDILSAEKIRTRAGDYKTVLAAAKEYGQIGKIYVMIGGNDLGYEDAIFIKSYENFVDALKKQYPTAEIYLQSIPPVTGTEEQLKNYPNSNNEDIERYNLLIMKIAEDKGVNYLDVAIVLMDENGKLPTEFSPDGVHFVEEYYYKWFDYLKKHTA